VYKVGLGMKSVILLSIAMRVTRPTCTNCTACRYRSGRYRVSASGLSYMCWSASKIGASVNIWPPPSVATADVSRRLGNLTKLSIG